MTREEILAYLRSIRFWTPGGIAAQMIDRLEADLSRRGANFARADERTEGQRVCDKYNALRV